MSTGTNIGPLSAQERQSIRAACNFNGPVKDPAVIRAAATLRLLDMLDAAEQDNASLRAQLAAASDRYARAVAEWDEVRGRLVAELAAATADKKNDTHG